MDRKIVATVCVILCVLGGLFYLYQMAMDLRSWHEYLYLICFFASVAVTAYPIACYGTISEVHSRYLLDRTWREQFAAYCVIALPLAASLLAHIGYPRDFLREELISAALLILFAGESYYSYRKQRRSL